MRGSTRWLAYWMVHLSEHNLKGRPCDLPVRTFCHPPFFPSFWVVHLRLSYILPYALTAIRFTAKFGGRSHIVFSIFRHENPSSKILDSVIFPRNWKVAGASSATRFCGVLLLTASTVQRLLKRLCPIDTWWLELSECRRLLAESTELISNGFVTLRRLAQP